MHADIGETKLSIHIYAISSHLPRQNHFNHFVHMYF